MNNLKNIQPKWRFNVINSKIAYLTLENLSIIKCGKTPSTKNELFWWFNIFLSDKFLFLSIEEIKVLKRKKDQLNKRKTYYLNNMFI